MSLKARIFLYIFLLTVAMSVVQVFFISKMYFDFQQKLGEHKGVATGMLVGGLEKSVSSLKMEANLLSCPYNIGRLLQSRDDTSLMKWEKRMLKQGREVVFVYANGDVVSINSNFIDSAELHSTGILTKILQYENHTGIVKIGSGIYVASGEPIKAAGGDDLGAVIVFLPVTPQFLAAISDDRQIVRVQLGDTRVDSRPHVADSSPFERVAIQIEGFGAEEGFYLSFLPNELLRSLKELQQSFLFGVPILAILSSLVLVCVLHVLLKPYGRILGYMSKYYTYDITLNEMRDGIFATTTNENPDLLKFKAVMLRMIDTIMAHIESIGSHTLRLEELTRQDALTGLLNRSGIDYELGAALEMCQKDGSPLSILIIDIDRFKSINDTLGHLAGDKVLCRVANALSDPTKNCATVGRWGGEEFLIVCRGMEGKLALELAESLRNAVHSIEIAAGKHVTISIGVAQVTSNETLANLLARADAALCRAKSSGRDFVAIG